MKKVADHLFRGPRPKSYIGLRDLGFKRVLSLQSGAEDFLTDSLLEHQKPEACGIELIRIKCSNVFPPDYYEILQMLNAMSDLDIKTYVHCHSGVDRTGIAVVAYRMIFQKMGFDEAMYEWQREGRHWWFFWWRPFIKRRLQRYFKNVGRPWAK